MFLVVLLQDDMLLSTIGAAIRCITSEPVPCSCIIGNNPAIITATVIALGRTRRVYQCNHYHHQT